MKTKKKSKKSVKKKIVKRRIVEVKPKKPKTPKIKCVFFDMEGTLFKKVIKAGKGNVAPSAWV